MVMEKFKSFLISHKYKLIVISVILIIAGIILHQKEYSHKSEYIFTSKDGVILIVETNSLLKHDELKKLFSEMNYTSIIDMKQNESNIRKYFYCNYISIDEFTVPIATSFDEKGRYKPIYNEFQPSDKIIMMRNFIKDAGLSESFINYVTTITKEGASTERASSIYLLNAELTTNDNKN